MEDPMPSTPKCPRPAALARTRWAAIGAAVAVAIGAGAAVHQVSADSRTSAVVTITPVRVVDTRSGIGLSGPLVSAMGREVTITGPIPVTSGPDRVVVPEGATGVILNVTVVGPSAAGFVSVRPAGTPGPPATSSLNFGADAIVPNAVTVALGTDGKTGRIEVTYDAFGAAGPTTDLLIDVVGFLVDGGTGAAGPKGDMGDTGQAGPAGSARAYALVANSGGSTTLVPSRTSGFASVQRISGGHYCLTPSAASGIIPSQSVLSVTPTQLDGTDNFSYEDRVFFNTGGPCGTGAFTVRTYSTDGISNYISFVVMVP
jgi:hypothetical protein